MRRHVETSKKLGQAALFAIVLFSLPATAQESPSATKPRNATAQESPSATKPRNATAQEQLRATAQESPSATAQESIRATAQESLPTTSKDVADVQAQPSAQFLSTFGPDGSFMVPMQLEPPPAPTAESAKPVRQIVVSIPDRKLALLEGGRTVKLYSVAVGAPQSPSPEGEFKVINRIENPTYYKPGTVIEAGPENPLGTRWIGLNRKGYGIHGTNLPASIGKAASHGCIRMRQQDLEELFVLLREGDVVTIRAERDSELAQVMTLPAEPVTAATLSALSADDLEASSAAAANDARN